VGGRSLLRPNWDELMPVPGNGRYERSGILKGKELPQVFNPETGWFATANEMNIPAGSPIAEREVGFEWSDLSR
jgi:penicillin amidase